MSEHAPAALEVSGIEEHAGSSYPAPFDAPVAPRLRRVLGELFGLTDFGVNLVTLPPGAWSSQRHWHSQEDEFVYILSGTPTLVTDDGRTDLAPGFSAGFKAGTENGHHLVNDSDTDAVYLEIGSRKEDDDGHYADIDLQILGRAGGGWFTHRDGKPYPK